MTEKPNILFIFTDQHVKNSLEFYGSKHGITPNLNKLASESVIFDHAYTTSPICTPARASVQTGLYPFKHGMQTNIFMHGCMIHELVDTPSLLSRRLNEYGYQANLTGKWHLSWGEKAFNDPFYQENHNQIEGHLEDIDYPEFYKKGSALPTDVGYAGDDFPGHGGGGQNYPQYQQYLADNGLTEETLKPQNGGYEVTSGKEATVEHFLTNRALEQMDEIKDQEKPFFMMLNYWGPHSPYYVPSEFMDPFRETEFEQWASFEEDVSDKPRIHNLMRANRPDYSWERVNNELRFYNGFVHFIDYQVGRLMQYLEDNGLADNTVIIFSADHGDGMGIHNGLHNKSVYMYEETTSIPLLIKDPRIAQNGRREKKFANITDIYSTILDVAGVPDEVNRRHGRSLMPLVRQEPVSDWPETVVVESSGIVHCLMSTRMIRKGDWKYVFNAGDTDELYDLGNDPHEMTNLVRHTEHAPKLDEMKQALEDWMIEKGDMLLNQYKSLKDAPSPTFSAN